LPLAPLELLAQVSFPTRPARIYLTFVVLLRRIRGVQIGTVAPGVFLVEQIAVSDADAALGRLCGVVGNYRYILIACEPRSYRPFASSSRLASCSKSRPNASNSSARRGLAAPPASRKHRSACESRYLASDILNSPKFIIRALDRQTGRHWLFSEASPVSRLRPECLHLVSRFVRPEQE